MLIHTDSYLEKSSLYTKMNCEDYIFSNDKPFPYIILSDGCSSSKQTDIGARILTHVSKDLILKNTFKNFNLSIEYWNFGYDIINKTKTITNYLGLDQNVLDCTLIISFIDNDFLYILVYGDGSIIEKFDDGRLVQTNFKYDNNMPYYLSYLLDKKRNDDYLKLQKEKCVTKEIIQILPHFEVLGKVNYSINYMYSYNIFKIYKLTNNTVSISSDGIESFRNNNDINQDVNNDVIIELTSFKNFKGEFVKRRLNRALTDFNKNDIHHYDDLSFGTYIFLEDN